MKILLPPESDLNHAKGSNSINLSYNAEILKEINYSFVVAPETIKKLGPISVRILFLI